MCVSISVGGDETEPTGIGGQEDSCNTASDVEESPGLIGVRIGATFARGKDQQLPLQKGADGKGSRATGKLTSGN